MTVSRVSSYSIQQTTLQNSAQVQAKLAELQAQVSSGYKADTYQELNGQVEMFGNLEDTIARTSRYIDNNKQTSLRLSTTSSTLDQMIDTITSMNNTIIQRRNGTVGDNAAFANQLNGFWQTIAGQLNNSVDGRFLFSGSATNTQAVDNEHYPTLAVENTPDAGYYTGSTQDITARIQDGFEITSNVRADDPSFQKLFAALAMAKEGNTTNDDTKLAKAYDFAHEALQGIIGIQATVNAQKVTVDQTNDNLGNLKLYWQGVKEDVINTDMIGASTQVAINQGILQAAFQIFARINSLKLSDFLR